MSPRLPVDNPVPSVWTEPPHPLDEYQSTPKLPESCDVLIVGSGFAGVATAYHILEDKRTTPSVVLLDARKHASGATSRNGGHVKPDTYYNVSKYERIYGALQAAELAKFESTGVYATKQLVETEGLDCDFHLTRAVDVYMDPQHATETAAAYKRLLKRGQVDMADVEYTSKKTAERISGVKGAQCCFSFTAAQLSPRKMVLQLLSKLLERAALQAYSHTPVIRVSPRRDAEGHWTATTQRGSIKARKIIFCTNGYTASVLPQYVNKIVPVRGVCSHITTPKGTSSPHLANTYSLRFGGANYDYLIPRPDGSIVVGGARQTFLHDKESWYDSVKDDENALRASERYFHGYMQRHFRGWEDSGAIPDRVWTGIMGYTSDLMPHIGEVPGAPSQYIIAGFSGHGMPQILLASKGLVAMVTKNLTYEQTGLPIMFKTTNERLSSCYSELEEGFKDVWASNISDKSSQAVGHRQSQARL
ncbi:uncharacterized protein A1O9_09421 [Exophiala aquamarina CBS 119918]|uniref:FAD dependent oxidoreductase domain-containing protein n=1 Tax=Exophiala aquamarina CBS 119918 TaxID=1182545 RepID=A0A072PFD0_9EURO|nr:uncharacterized protein A1O9_09421 [Exophiala aquamarina CBS 119918]KEF54255.1 hypothetical protein A1O9_09421 [Exophiala aquamarina CBS 119918]